MLVDLFLAAQKGRLFLSMQSSQISFMQPSLYFLVVPCLILYIRKYV